MKFKEDKINELLAEWDLTGSVNVDPRWPLVEYKDQVIPMMNFYKEKGNVYEYVKQMFESMLGTPDVKALNEIKEYAEKFNAIMKEDN